MLIAIEMFLLIFIKEVDVTYTTFTTSCPNDLGMEERNSFDIFDVDTVSA